MKANAVGDQLKEERRFGEIWKYEKHKRGGRELLFSYPINSDGAVVPLALIRQSCPVLSVFPRIEALSNVTSLVHVPSAKCTRTLSTHNAFAVDQDNMQVTS